MCCGVRKPGRTLQAGEDFIRDGAARLQVAHCARAEPGDFLQAGASGREAQLTRLEQKEPRLDFGLALEPGLFCVAHKEPAAGEPN